MLNGALVSAVNWAELVQKSLKREADVSGMGEEFSDAGVTFEPFTLRQAELAAGLWEKTRRQGALPGRPELTGTGHGTSRAGAVSRLGMEKAGAEY